MHPTQRLYLTLGVNGTFNPGTISPILAQHHHTTTTHTHPTGLKTLFQ